MQPVDEVGGIAAVLAQRWILARLRDITFFTLEDLNLAIANLLEEMNDKPFQKMDGCRRRSHFEEIEKRFAARHPR